MLKQQSKFPEFVLLFYVVSCIIVGKDTVNRRGGI